MAAAPKLIKMAVIWEKTFHSQFDGPGTAISRGTETVGKQVMCVEGEIRSKHQRYCSSKLAVIVVKPITNQVWWQHCRVVVWLLVGPLLQCRMREKAVQKTHCGETSWLSLAPALHERQGSEMTQHISLPMSFTQN